MTRPIPPDQAAMVAKFSDAMAASAMAQIAKATCDQGPTHATLNEWALREAIRAGIAGYLVGEIQKRHEAWRNRPDAV